jgi:hypothetical protein
LLSKDKLNNYKDTDFIGVVTVTSVEQHLKNHDVDVINFSTQEVFKGNKIKDVSIFQKKGFGKDNTNCRLYLKPGDQLLLYATKKPGFYFTMPCYRYCMINNTDLAYQETLQNHIKILRELTHSQKG